MALTEKEFTIVVLVALALVILAGIFVYWISKKYPTRKQKTDPIFKAIRASLMLTLLYGLILLFGLRSQEDARKDVKWLIITFIVLLIFYAVVSYFINKPIPSYKLWINYVLPDVKQFWNAVPYVGNAYFTPMLFHAVIDVTGNVNLRLYLEEQGKTPEKIEVFYGQAVFGNVFPFMSVRNKYTGEDVMMARPPILTVALIQKFLGEELVSSFAPALSEYGVQEEGIASPQKQVTVSR